ncbi:UNVERIFIED_CONTAM: hypothetical protein GTU68_015845 [Idotea baltica]|nr:hypothetical protein [Idotea baltica]
MTYKRSGKSGVLLPVISLGLWHNFGFVDDIQNARDVLRCAFDLGITHFDLANNYGPPPGSAEENFGTIFKSDFKQYRDELFIATKAGYGMWEGPYGDFGSRKYLISSLDQSLKRMNLDYADVFYHHRPDPDTPLEETMGALADIVRQGKALYVGISNYNPEDTLKASELLRELKKHLLYLHQARIFPLFGPCGLTDGLLDTLEQDGLGCIAFSPLAQGMLTDKYLNGIPEKSRAGGNSIFLNNDTVNNNIEKIIRLAEIANNRDQKLSQMAIAWILRQPQVVSVLIGASSADQLKENVTALDNLEFTDEELKLIDNVIS